MADTPTRAWAGYPFQLVCRILPEGSATGTIREFMPQARYRNLRGLRLNSYGSGPFCEFRIPRDFHASGVYVLTVDDEAVYVGECDDLSARYNIGYGNISPRNCFEGGQMTNCRVNNLIYQAASAGKTIALWFFDTPKQKAVEADLIARLQPPWNRKGIATR